MSSSQEDYEVGYKRPPKETRWKKGQTGNPARRHPGRSISALEMIDRQLLRPVEIVEKGETKKVTALEVILLQLWRQDLAGDRRALGVRLKYERIAREKAAQGVEIEFVESSYTRALAAGLLPESSDDE
jgi:Family of unknown function (DUF5681)